MSTKIKNYQKYVKNHQKQLQIRQKPSKPGKNLQNVPKTIQKL